MIRLLLLIAVGYLGYKVLKSLLTQGPSHSRNVSSKPSDQIDDVMVKDPFCGTYFARNQGVHLKSGGEDLYFCSAECRDKYLAEASKTKTQE
jgi:uncharacterized protein